MFPFFGNGSMSHPPLISFFQFFQLKILNLILNLNLVSSGNTTRSTLASRSLGGDGQGRNLPGGLLGFGFPMQGEFARGVQRQVDQIERRVSEILSHPITSSSSRKRSTGVSVFDFLLTF